jgi:hypothetical protein
MNDFIAIDRRDSIYATVVIINSKRMKYILALMVAALTAQMRGGTATNYDASVRGTFAYRRTAERFKLSNPESGDEIECMKSRYFRPIFEFHGEAWLNTGGRIRTLRRAIG